MDEMLEDNILDSMNNLSDEIDSTLMEDTNSWSILGTMWKVFRGILLTGFCIVGIMAVKLYFSQDSILYHPVLPGIGRRPKDAPTGLRSPTELNLQFDDYRIQTKDGEYIHAWFLPQKNAKKVPTVIFFHGNAGHIGFRLPNANLLVTEAQVNVLLVEYRGYGDSTGTATEIGLQHDAEAAIDFALNQLANKIDPERVFVFGRSLGGAVAVSALHSRPDLVHKLSGLILENTFTSISDMVDKIFPALSSVKKYLQRIYYPTVDRIEALSLPILFVSGENDELIPSWHMQQLAERAVQSSSRHFYTVPDGHHNDCWQKDSEVYISVFKYFMLSYSKSKTITAEQQTEYDKARIVIERLTQRIGVTTSLDKLEESNSDAIRQRRNISTQDDPTTNKEEL